jgi:complement component 1 Q subcomponent-binding protein
MVEAVAQDGMVVVENVFYHKNAALATAQTAEADWERRGAYAGPPFGNLDEDLQVLLERYLDERGINTQLALFIPDYIDFKEQKEYLSWLENVKGFVTA